jgi:hypothetical protein
VKPSKSILDVIGRRKKKGFLILKRKQNMGWFGGSGDDKKKPVKIVRTPRGHVIIKSDDNQQPPQPPARSTPAARGLPGQAPKGILTWQQALGQAQNTRSKFWNSAGSSKRGRAAIIRARHR